MTDRDKAGLRGPVRTVRHHRGVPAHLTVEWFNPEGALVMSECEYPDGSGSQTEYVYDAAGRLRETRSDDEITRTYEYDNRGRLVRVYLAEDGTKQLCEEIRHRSDGSKSKVEHLPPPGDERVHAHRIEGTDELISAQGASSITTNYDAAGYPLEVLVHNSENTLLLRTALRHDAAGRVIEMVQQVGDTAAFAGVPEMAGMPAEMRNAFEQIFTSGTVMGRTSFSYDDQGRCVGRISSGPFDEGTDTTTYDEQGNVLTELRYDERRDIEIDQSGHITGTRERGSSVFETRFEYEYDEHGNWTKCTTYSRGGAGKEFTNSGVEHRTISYY